VRVLPDPDRATDEAGRIGVGFERVVADEGGLVFIRAVIARAGGDGADAFDRGDEGKLPDAGNSKWSAGNLQTVRRPARLLARVLINRAC
jgi:hypothetical protein